MPLRKFLILGERSMWMWIVWPAFLVAAILEMLVFAVLDPQMLTIFGSRVEWSREAIYTITFFIFWIMMMASSTLTVLLSRSSAQINHLASPKRFTHQNTRLEH